MRIGFLFFGLGLAAVVFSGLGLAWDGAYQLAYTLENQFVITPYGRYTQAPLLAIVLVLSLWTNSSLLLAWTFQALHALLPLFALFGAWRIVRSRRPELFVWIAFGIGLATLPAQACLVCQSLTTVQLGWILFAAIATGMTRVGAIFTMIAMPLMFFHHPVAIILFALASAFSFGRGALRPERRSRMWKWALVFFAVMLLAAARAFFNQNEYETTKLTRVAWDAAWELGVAGVPLRVVALSWLAAVLVVVETYSGKCQPLVRGVALATIGVAFLVSHTWANDAHAWASAIEYRNWSVWLSIPFFVLLLLDEKRANVAFRKRVAQMIAVGFAVVLLLQSATWMRLTERLQVAMETSPSICVEARHIEGLPGTALGGWTLTSYAMLIQGKQPQKIVYYWEACSDLEFSEGYWLANIGPWDYYKWNVGWFDKSRLREHLFQAN